jgi:hypothetical protein
MSSFLSHYCIVCVSGLNDFFFKMGSFYPNLAVVFSLNNVLEEGQNLLES